MEEKVIVDERECVARQGHISERVHSDHDQTVPCEKRGKEPGDLEARRVKG